MQTCSSNVQLEIQKPELFSSLLTLADKLGKAAPKLN